MDRLVAVVRDHASGSAQSVVEALCAAVADFAAPAPLEDDLTLLVVKAL
jgi:serine phosphatase RsbU (regulator of sigma subunit)